MPSSAEAKRALIAPHHDQLSLRRQCQWWGLNRARGDYQPALESPEHLALMRLIDEHYWRTPYYSSRRMTAWRRGQGQEVNRQRVQRLMSQMGLAAIEPRPRPRHNGLEHRIYPDLRREVMIDHPHRGWSTAITSIPMPQGFRYRGAMLDWDSRYVVAWQGSNTLATDCCLGALETALGQTPPQSFNTDQGVQFSTLLTTS